jgi:hypothetical protein
MLGGMNPICNEEYRRKVNIAMQVNTKKLRLLILIIKTYVC